MSLNFLVQVLITLLRSPKCPTHMAPPRSWIAKSGMGSFLTKRIDRINATGATRGDQACEQRGDQQERNGNRKGRQRRRLHPFHKTQQHASRKERTGGTDNNSDE